MTTNNNINKLQVMSENTAEYINHKKHLNTVKLYTPKLAINK